jgi:hypothetical protein
MFRRLPVVGLLQLFAAAAFGQIAPRVDMPENMRQAFLVVLNQDNLAGVISKLGSAQIRIDGGKDDQVRSLCYKSGTSQSLTAVIIASHDHIGGPDHFVDEIRVVRADSSRIDLSKCAPTRLTVWTEGTPAGLRLGMTEAELTNLLPKPAFKDAGRLIMYSWSTDKPVPSDLTSYAFWHSKLAECFRKGRDKTYARGQIAVRLASGRVYEFVLNRGPMTCCCGIGGD